MPKNLLLVLTLTVISLTAILTIVFNLVFTKPILKSDLDGAVHQAKLLYKQKKATGDDLSSGPCLSDALRPNWVADLVHNPRQSIDDLPQNQCPSYLDGRAQHFVELDLEGNLVRVK